PLDFDCAEFLLHSFATIPYGWPIEVFLELSLEEAQRRIAPDVGTLEATRGGVILRAQADYLEWMARLLVQVGCPFRVLHPPELRTVLRQMAHDIKRYARRGDLQSRAKTASPGRTTAASPAKVA